MAGEWRTATVEDHTPAQHVQAGPTVEGHRLSVEQPGVYALRRVPVPGLSDWQRGGGGGLPARGQGPYGRHGQALVHRGGPGDAGSPGDLLQWRLEGVSAVCHHDRDSPAVSSPLPGASSIPGNSIAGGKLRPNRMPLYLTLSVFSIWLQFPLRGFVGYILTEHII
jgi:hypothetical protein